MEVQTAVQLINDAVFRPGWEITAEDYSHRHESCVCVSYIFETWNFVKEEAPTYPTRIKAPNTIRCPLIVADMGGVEDLFYAVLQQIGKINSHEDREALRVGSTLWAPFYPHRVDGQKRWADRNGSTIDEDLLFGVA